MRNASTREGAGAAPRNLLGARTALDQCGERLGLIGGVHRETVEALGEARLGGSLAVGTEHEARDLVIAGQHFVFGKREHGPAAAFAGLDLELALGPGTHHKVLQEPMCGNASLELSIGGWIAMTADVARRGYKFVEGYRLKHRLHS